MSDFLLNLAYRMIKQRLIAAHRTLIMAREVRIRQFEPLMVIMASLAAIG